MPLIFLYITIISWFFISSIKNFNTFVFLPQDIYNCTNLNKFGCIILSIILIAINPLSAILQFFDWIFQMGRKE